MDQLVKLGPFAALSRLWNEFSAPQRVVVAAFAAVSLVTVVVIGVVASKPRMAVLFSGLEAEDAGAIVQKLSEQKVPYKISSDGGTIEVPASSVDDLRLQMATQGLPQGGTVGFEIFDKNTFGMTEFAERLSFQRAIQGELTRTISQLAPVMKARVLIAMPEDKLYSSEQQPVTASVVLKLRRGMPLSDERVAGIVHLVASSVEGLKPSNVTVIDSDGSVLSQAAAGGEGAGLLTTNQSKLKRQYESELAQNLQSMLTRIVGPDKAVVRVSADVGFDQMQTKTESYEPVAPQAGLVGESGAAQPGAAPHGVMLSQETRSETYSGSVIPPAGVPAGTATVARSSGDNYTRTESSTQYQVTRKIEEVVSAPGQLKRLSVAVLVDEKVEPAKLAAIREAVGAAAGFDSTRGDQITVQRMAFDTSAKKAEEEAMATASRSELIQTIARNAGAVLLLVVFLVILRAIVKQIRIVAPAPPPAPVPQPAGASMDMAELLGQPASTAYSAPAPRPQQTSGYSTAAVPEALPPEVAQSNPEDLARLVRSWMSEQ